MDKTQITIGAILTALLLPGMCLWVTPGMVEVQLAASIISGVIPALIFVVGLFAGWWISTQGGYKPNFKLVVFCWVAYTALLMTVNFIGLRYLTPLSAAPLLMGELFYWLGVLSLAWWTYEYAWKHFLPLAIVTIIGGVISYAIGGAIILGALITTPYFWVIIVAALIALITKKRNTAS